MTGSILNTIPLDEHWPGVDPFLFCNYHVDHYPKGDGKLGPAEPLSGRQIGSDFSGRDGWNMYHGTSVPGFPSHPHRGFETLTFVPQGLVDHADSLGATARYGNGDVQWLTAGRGIVHAEMFPLVREDAANPLELFQIWINLPATSKMVDPHFTMSWDSQIPRVTFTDDDGRRCEVKVIAGTLDGRDARTPPPNSWAARTEAEFAIWHIDLEPEARWELPLASERPTRMLYFFDGDVLDVDGNALPVQTAAELRPETPVSLRAGSRRARAMLMQAVPIGEPVAQHGPFVMNTHAEIREAFEDFARNRFGGWPWPSEEPTHAVGQGRFAHHADGHEDSPEATPGDS